MSSTWNTLESRLSGATSKSSGPGAPGQDLLDSEDIEDISAFEFPSETPATQKPASGFVALVFRIIRRKRFLLAGAVLLAGGAFLYLYQSGLLVPEAVLRIQQSHPAAAPLLFMLIYAMMVLFLLPTLPLNLGAGFLWGPYLGWAYSMIGATTGACAAFLMTRYLAYDYLNAKFNHRAWRWLQDAITESGWKAVAFARINPIFPFGPVNFFFGTTSIPFVKFLWSTVAFIALPALAISYIGNSVGGLAQKGDVESQLAGLALASLIITLTILVRIFVKRLMLNRRHDLKRIGR